MTSGVSNAEKAQVRAPLRPGQGHAARSCWTCEMASYHGPGTCTFYGTANSNQMMMEMMGLHLPGAAFVNPEHAAARRPDGRRAEARGGDPRRRQRLHADGRGGRREERWSTRMVGLLATGGSTNHTLHLVAMAPRRRRRRSTWEDFDDLSPRHPADRPGLSERLGGRERLPRRRRHGLRDPPAAGRRPGARRRHDRRRPGPAPLPAPSPSWTAASWSGARARPTSLEPRHPAAGRRSLPDPRAACAC